MARPENIALAGLSVYDGWNLLDCGYWHFLLPVLPEFTCEFFDYFGFLH
jgi:hypothetical protein